MHSYSMAAGGEVFGLQWLIINVPEKYSCYQEFASGGPKSRESGNEMGSRDMRSRKSGKAEALSLSAFLMQASKHLVQLIRF